MRKLHRITLKELNWEQQNYGRNRNYELFCASRKIGRIHAARNLNSKSKLKKWKFSLTIPMGLFTLMREAKSLEKICQIAENEYTKYANEMLKRYDRLLKK